MSSTPQENFTGLQCLQMLLSQTRRNVNFMALVSNEVQQEFLKDNHAVITKIADEQQLRPEPIDDIKNLSNYNGPVLAHLNTSGWILIINSAQLFSGDKVSIFDPSLPAENQKLLVPKDQLLSRVTTDNIVFRNLTQVDSTKQTKLYAFSAIAGHHNAPVDLREIMHEYAIGEEEVSELLFKQIVNDRGFKLKTIHQSWDKLLRSETVFPCIIEKKNGKYAIICGIRKKEDQQDIVIVDPEEQQNTGPGKFLFLSKEDFEQKYSNKLTLLKKIYKLSDESQPFSLRWFIPEFIKNKAIFGQIILMVVLLTIFSLVVPLFFQIVVDKVLVNAAYNTLNVLGVGILCVILFNTLTSYIRSYLLLFATNKIDISTATKTFTHLMRLPVDFFDKVPSGVLLKHMQQTEKIRGFLSGNLFFTLLDIFALCIFIPFLMFYSMTLTFIVLGFSALMALVIACLIKPFQRRLDELYQAEGKRQSMLVEAIHGIKTVKSLALEPVERKIWDDSTAYAIKSYFRVGKISMTAQSISQMLEMMMTICVIWIGAHLVFGHVISIGALIAFQMLANRVTGPLVKIVGLIHEYQQIALSVRMLGVVMNTPPEPAGGGVRNALKGGIEFENITFQYGPDLPQVIKNFSLKVNP